MSKEKIPKDFRCGQIFADVWVKPEFWNDDEKIMGIEDRTHNDNELIALTRPEALALGKWLI